MRRTPRSWLAVLIPLLALAGCGGGSKTSHPAASQRPATLSATPQQSCPPDGGRMGCSLNTQAQNPTRPGTALLHLSIPSGGLLPDVSNWQGDVDWGRVAAWQQSHGWKRAGIFKLGEYRLDAYAARNASETARLGLWRAGYWFVRNTGCQNEASQIIWAAKRFGLKVVVEDDEVPEAAGYSTCLTPRLRAAGLTVVIYAGTGTWPGGNAFNSPLWIASYGPGFGCLWTCHPVAWQFTDGNFNSPVYIPGIGKDDVSVDYGITKLGATPRVRCFGTNRQISHHCDVIRWRVGHWQRSIPATRNQLTAHGCWRFRNHRTAPRPCRGLFARGDRLHKDVTANLY